MKKMFSARLETELIEKLEDLAKKYQVTRSEVLRQILMAAFAGMEKNNENR